MPARPPQSSYNCAFLDTPPPFSAFAVLQQRQHSQQLHQPEARGLCQLLTPRSPWRREKCPLLLHQQSPEGGAFQQFTEQRAPWLDMTASPPPTASPSSIRANGMTPPLAVWGGHVQGALLHLIPFVKHIRLFMARPLWFLCAVLMHMCVYALCTL